MKNMLGTAQVAISHGHNGYAATSPYSPATGYPEYSFGSETLSAAASPAYDGVRDSLRLLGLDAEHFGQEDWNPLGRLIRPGDTVVLKPNCVREFRETQSGHGDCLITHGSVIRAVLDYAYIALHGRGRIIIADAPHNDADFEAIRAIAGLTEIQEFYRRHVGFEVEVYDLRAETARKVDGVIVGHEKLPGDPAGYVKVNLGRESAFTEVNDLCHLLYGSEYDTREIRSHHHDDVHEYMISKTVLDADCVISLPKLKTHKKTGVTLSMKNMVGINGNKNWLPHHREGTPAQGGDQFADDRLTHRIERRAVAGFKHIFPLLGPLRRVAAKPIKAMGRKAFGDTNTDTIRSGNWYGNDTTWRMAVDLNRILMYADAEGQVRSKPQRWLFSIVDGIVGGEGNGPLDPTPRRAGVILAGANPVAVDLVCTRLMGFDYQRLPILHRALDEHPLALTDFKYDEVLCLSNDQRFSGPLPECDSLAPAFMPHFGWQGHVGITRPDVGPLSSPRGRWTRKRLWDSTPRPVRKALGCVLRTVPKGVLLGKRFRQQVAFAEQSQWWSIEQVREYQLSNVRTLCEIAYSKTQYYRKAFDAAGFLPSELKGLEDLASLPTTDRDALLDSWQEMCTVDPSAVGVDLVATGGTSGRPLKFYMSTDRSAIEYGFLTTSWRRIGYKIGMPLAVLRGRIVPQNRDGLRYEYDAILRYHYYSAFHMTDQNMERYLTHIATVGPCFLHVYPSSVAALARFMLRKGIRPPGNIRGIIAESETVYPQQKMMVEGAFHCRYFSCYGHSEKLVLAAGCEHCDDYHVWPTYGYFELIDDDGNPVTEPDRRGEIVGTGFINKVTPCIRYRTGDRGTYVSDHCEACGRQHTIIRDIRGHRTQEVLIAHDGSEIPWVALNMHDDTFLHVRQFQFLQHTPGRAVLRMVVADGFGDEDRKRILHNLDRKLNGRVDLSIEIVSTIKLSDRGKAIYVDQRIDRKVAVT